MLNIKMNKLSLVMFFLLAGNATYAQPKTLHDDIQSIVNSYLAKEGKQEHVSGISLSISYPDQKNMKTETFYAGTSTHKIPAKPVTKTTLFDTGSITKSYTSAIILQLESEGHLDINDPVGKWLPQYTMWKDVKIKQLLNMTSGIPNYSDNDAFNDYQEKNLLGEYTDEFLLSFAHPDKAITPGKKYEYSNSNYILAGMIIEAITKQNFADVLQERILGPLHLNDTFYAAGPNWKYVNKITFPRKAHGYYFDYNKRKLLDLTRVNLSWGGAAGAIVSTTADQLKWVDALYHGTIFPKKDRAKLLHELTSVVSMKTGQPIDTVNENDSYGFGLGVGYAYEKNQRFWYYEGSTLGYRMLYTWKQCNNVTVMAALNSKGGEGDADSPISDKISKLVSESYAKVIELHPNLNCND